MPSTAEFGCVTADGQTALVHVIQSDDKEIVQCMVQSITSKDCYFQPDIQTCEVYRKSQLFQSSLALNCTSAFCLKVPSLIRATPAPTPTAMNCSSPLSPWKCFEDQGASILIRISSGEIECIADSAIRATGNNACALFPSLDACKNACPTIFANTSPPTKTCEGSMNGTISCIGGLVAPTTSRPPSSSLVIPPPTTSSKSPVDGSLSWVTIGLLAVVVVLVIACAVFFYRRRTSFFQRNSNENSSTVWLDPKADIAPLTTTSSTTDFVGIKLDMGDLSLWRLDESKLIQMDILATGANGVVSLGKYKGQQVAIKKQLASERTAENVQVFIDEIKLMSRLDSPFIVHFIGVSWLRPREIELVVEYMERGDLRRHLESTPYSSLSWWPQKIQIALDVIEGLLYLHSMDIIHRDLKARNVLLHHNLRAKLTDFGIARECTEETMTQGVGTCRWTAPEVLEGNHYTVAADVYSFGMVLVELDTHAVPYMHMGEVSNFVLMERLREGTISPTVTTTCPQSIETLLRRCIAWDPSDRPSALEISTTLRTLTP